jgi:hypothetical protein
MTDRLTRTEAAAAALAHELGLLADYLDNAAAAVHSWGAASLPDEMRRRADSARAIGLRHLREIQAARVADPDYTPTTREAAEHPQEFVEGMKEIP